MLRLLVLIALLVSCRSFGNQQRAALERPNIVLVLADDMGWGDLDSAGIARPHLDQLAADGRRFQDFYVAAAVCSASRRALLTGCYPGRAGIQASLPAQASIGLNPSEPSLAEVRQSRAYRIALFGKWHLGDAPAFGPREHGFDEFFGLKSTHASEPGPGEMDFDRRNRTEPMTRELTERAIEFSKSQAAAKRPFFLYLAHPMPRVLLQAMRLGRWKLHFAQRYRCLPPGQAGRGGTAGRYSYGQQL